MATSETRGRLIAVSSRSEQLEARTDEQLLLLVRGGMREAFDVLVARHQPRALRVAMRYLDDRTLARDVAQSAFLELYRQRHRYQERGQFRAYFYRITVNQSRMAVRSARPASPLSGEESAPTDLAGTLRREYSRDVQRALSQLSDKLRVVVILRYGEDLDLAEIAETLNLPLGTVKRRLFDAMAKLRELLGGAM